MALIGLATVPVSVWLAVKTLSKLTTVQEGLVNAEMSRRLRAERLRTELISNVSHDIRTPLTSVITYVELLRGEELENEKARGYIAVIASKSQRLKQLTDDLFEASKAASGNIPVAFERVDLNELVTQGLGEMDAKIRESGLDFRVTLPGEPEFVSADGKLLWRVVENLLSNVFKYAMAGSRVYVETSADESNASLSIKNISENALNIPAEDLLERFRRGDEARGGEGSGLGLAIAKSLTEAMGGRFELSVDGDLFKATVT
jgi:signal transduction histidine kinase